MSDYLRGGLYVDGILIIPCDNSDNQPSDKSNKCCISAYKEKCDYDDILLWWELPGHGSQGDYCGEIRSFLACANPDHRTSDNIRRIKNCCWQATCPVCYEKWASREARRATDRIEQIEALYNLIYMPLGNIRHIIFSPPQLEAKELMKTKKGFKRLKKEALKVIKSSGITGGLITFHAERRNEAGWYSSPHFHVLGYGYLKDARTFHKDTNWIYKNKGVRESVYSTIQYLLSHAGIAREQDSDDNKRPFQVVNWFGALSYYYVSKAEEIKRELTYPCKVCGEPLHRFTNVDEGDEGKPVDWSDAVDEGEYMVQIKESRYELRHLKQLRMRYEVGRDGFLRHRVQTKEGRERRKDRKDIVDEFGRLKSG